MKKLCGFLLIILPLLWSCSSNNNSTSTSNNTAHSSKGSSMAFKDISVTELATLQKQIPNLKLVDVRTPKEVEAGSIEGHVAIDFYGDNFKDLISELDKEQPTLMYCRSGGRSGKAMQMMQEMGFKEVYNLEGGYIAYAKHFY